MQYETQIAQIQQGHIALAVCAALYLVWWAIYFRPGAAETPSVVRAVGVACILGAIVTGFFAVVRIVQAQGGLQLLVSAWMFVVAGLVVYFVLLAITKLAFGRPVTTELALIVGWLVLEAIALEALFACGAVGTTMLVVLAIIVALAAVGALICYVLYYQLPMPASFFDGCGPLVAVLVVSVVLALAGA